MEFEWDPKKSEGNRKKHGLAFGEAIQIWQGTHLTIENIARSKDGEIRNATLGLIQDTIYLAIWTVRANRTRLISVRRARDGEKEIFKKRV